MRTVWRFHKKLKIELSYDPASPHLGIYLEKTFNSKIMHPVFIAALFTIAKTWKQPKYPLMDEWIKKICVCMYTHNGVLLFSHIKNEIMSFALTWMDLEIIILRVLS